MSTVFVSGISRGIGLGIAKRYLTDGHQVIGSIRNENQEVKALRAAHPDALKVVTLDVGDRGSVDAAAKEVSGMCGSLDILICSAAVNPAQSGDVTELQDIDDRDVLDTFDINVVGPLRLVRAFHPLLKKTGGGAKVVIISSGAGSLAKTSNGGMIPYCVSKTAVNMLCLRLHFLLEADGIAVLALSPGWVKTDMGGPNAVITAEESAKGIAKVVEAYTRDAPPFQDYQGNTIPW